MLRSLVGSEMCIRDRYHSSLGHHPIALDQRRRRGGRWHCRPRCTTTMRRPPQEGGAGAGWPACRLECGVRVRWGRVGHGLACNPPVLCVDTCLLYTSDAADEEDSVDLGGRRIINKKNKVESVWRYI
eukprot:TRINITY_DN59021_c0_g1_i1.p2 TRINITY_DN59021_c0_g1~~TRINITY_DN59021_c0_g1_i1.p2  ORF type:complete len:128 (-),score=14.65 TRINITY_DN59021_c0_g1_i1:3-386(-)